MHSQALPGILVLLLASPLAIAQAPGSSGVVLTDAENDTTISLTGQPLVPLLQTVTWTDLRSLAVLETEEGFLITVQYYPDPSGRQAGAPTNLDVYFEHNGQTYWLDLYSREQDSGAALYKYDLQTRYQGLVAPLERIVDEAARTYSAFVGRSMVLDAQGAPPFPGRELVFKHVDSFTIQFYSDQVQLNDWDRMPDQGEADIPYVVRLGAQAQGNARLLSANPSRASNGGAAAYVYEILVGNEGSGPATYRLDASDVPSAWSMEIPVSAIRLEAGEYRKVPVIVSTPFAHQHGASETATLQLTDIDDSSSRASLPIHIIYHDVPQPAGHHDTLYLHSKNGPATPADEARAIAADVYMNALQEDSDDQGAMAYCSTPNLAGTTCGWDILLGPSLKIGLDFDTARQGILKVPIGSKAALIGATIYGELIVAGRNSTTLANLGPATISSTDPNGVAMVELELTPTDGSDFVPFDGAGNMILRLAIDVGHPVAYTSVETPYLAPGGFLELPLNEYRETLSPSANGPNALFIEGPSQRRANPGDTLVFPFKAAATLGPIELVGVHAEWAWLTTSERGARYVVVNVPRDAGSLELADVLLQAEGPDGVELARIIVLVDSEQDYPDDSALAATLRVEPGKDAPGSTMALALLSLALAAYRVHRRRGQ